MKVQVRAQWAQKVFPPMNYISVKLLTGEQTGFLLFVL